jgi:CheY-like chemotaxis protein
MSNQPDVALIDVCLEGGREGIEIALWLRKVCEVPIVFVTAYGDEDTLERIHEQVPGAPVLSKPGLSSHACRCCGRSDQALNSRQSSQAC